MKEKGILVERYESALLNKVAEFLHQEKLINAEERIRFLLAIHEER